MPLIPHFLESFGSMKSDKTLHVLKVGDRIRIKPEWQDEGDDYERIVVEAPEDSARVLVQTIIPCFTHNPVARIETSMLERVEVGVAY
jgi:hypothetical protein